MASLFTRSNGVFYVSYRVGDKRKQQSTHCRDRAQAMAVLEAVSRELEPCEKISVSGFRVQLQKLLEGNVAQSTASLYDMALRAFERIVGDIKLQGVSAYHIDLFKATRLKEVAAATVARDFRHLKAAFRRAYLWKMVDSTPFTGVRNVRVPEAPPQFLTPAECEHLLQVIPSLQIRLIVIFAVSTGMRIGEIVSLRWSDLDQGAMLIRITNRDGFTTKNRRSRVVPMNGTVLDILQRLPRRGEYVFLGQRGKKLNSGWVSRRFKTYAREAGLSERVHFHSLRHTFASWLVQNNVPILNVKEILGHRNIATTLVYARSTSEQLKESVKSIDGYLRAVSYE
jgi:integrase